MKKDFEKLYIELREKEGRILNTSEIRILPKTQLSNPNQKEWMLREKSVARFTNYLANQNANRLLEVGCGNGWFTNCCSKYLNKTIGIDINETELQQARLSFPNLDFMYWDIFEDAPFQEQFDIIVLSAVIQYFPNFEATIERLSEFLTKNGEIHIIDSPFYEASHIQKAKERTKAYYTKMGIPEMSQYYFHHTIDQLKGFKILYKPIQNKFLRKLKSPDSPFSWYCLKK